MIVPSKHLPYHMAGVNFMHMDTVLRNLLHIIVIVVFIGSCNHENDSKESEVTNSVIPIEIITEIGLANQPIEYQLGQPVAVRTDSEGNIYIADRASLTVKVFDEYGTYLRSFGGRGRGPGEFQQINFMEVTDEGTLYFLDRGKLEYIYMTMQGEYIISYPIRISRDRMQYYPHRVFWYDDKTIGIRSRSDTQLAGHLPFNDLPLFHIFSRDFQEHHESFYPFGELGYSEDETYIWISFAYMPGSFDMSSDKGRLIYSPGVYNGLLYEFARQNEQWEGVRILEGTPPHSGPYDIYTDEVMYYKMEDIPGVNRIYFSGGPYIGRLYSIDVGIYYLQDGRIVHFYGEWRGGDTTLEEGNTLDINAQIFETDGTIAFNGYLISVEWDEMLSVVLVNWKDDEDNFYLLNLPKEDIPTVIKFRLDL